MDREKERAHPTCGNARCKWHRVFGTSPQQFQSVMYLRAFTYIVDANYSHEELVELIKVSDELG